MDGVALKKFMRKKRITQKEMARLCGVSLSAFRRRIDGKVEFKIGEIEIMAVRLGLDKSEIRFIFFNQKVS